MLKVKNISVGILFCAFINKYKQLECFGLFEMHLLTKISKFLQSTKPDNNHDWKFIMNHDSLTIAGGYKSLNQAIILTVVDKEWVH